MGTRWMRNGFVYMLIAVAIVAIFFTLFSDLDGSQEIPISEAVEMVRSEMIDTIEVRGDKITLVNTRGEIFTSRKEEGYSVFEMLEAYGVDPSAGGVQILNMDNIDAFHDRELVLNGLDWFKNKLESKENYESYYFIKEL